MLTTIVALLIALLILALLLGGAFYLYLYWWLIQRAGPELDGDVAIDCLDQPVEILRDRHAVPHIYAQNRADLFRAQGFVHAQDRLWQMEQHRRVAQGRLAEIFGEAALEADRFSRIVGFWRAAQAEEAVLDDETRQVLDWYAEGVNAYIASRPANRLAAEFNLLRVEPEPWTALDSIGYSKVVDWALSINWESELTRLRLMELMGPIRAAELDPDYPGKNPIILDALGSDEKTRLLSTAGLLLNEYENVKQWLGNQGGQQGSNSWVLSPKNSLNRRPLLCCDPHLTVQIPGHWVEGHLACPGYEVSGVTFTGLPGVIIGHNQEIAWGVTAAPIDVQDLYVERRHPDDPAQFEFQGEWERARVFEERIVVRRRAEEHVEKVVVTRHGPLINGLLDAGQGGRDTATANTPLALHWTGHEPSRSLAAMLRLNEAANWDEFDAALAGWQATPLDFVYADARGNIGYRLAGRLPIRESNLGLVPAVGWTGAQEWKGFIPDAEMPRLYNPPSGKIVAANNKMVGDDYPYFLGVEFFPGWRAARLEEMLAEKERYTIRDMEEMQLDTTSAYAAALTPWITLLNSDEAWERVALDALKRWNFRMDAESVAATVFHFTLLNLLEMVFGDKLESAYAGYLGISSNPLFLANGFMMRAETRLLELLDGDEHSIWYMEAKSGRQRTREELLQEAFSKAVREIRAAVGDSTRRWNWGRLHQVRYVHPMGSVRLLNGYFNRGPLPVGGDSSTPNQTRHTPQKPPGLVQVTASYRQIYEVGVWDRSQTVNATGQSGHPLTDHYDDQIPMWREGAYHKMAWSREAVEEGTVFRMKLVKR